MIGLRLHGRGGQGAVVASKILANAYFAQGYYVQAFPSFGMERKGAAVTAFVRVAEEPIVERGEIKTPSIVLVLDPTLLQMVDVRQGLEKDALIVLNYPGAGAPKAVEGPFRVAGVDAARIAVRHRLGTATAPIVNTVILGALAATAGNLDLENLTRAIREGVPVKPEENAAAARDAHGAVRWLEGELNAD